MKTCKKCSTLFDTRNCPECHKRMNRACAKKWREKNPDAKAEADRNYYESNKDKIIYSVGEWQKNNPEKVKERQARYRAKYPDKTRVFIHNYRESKKNKGKLSKDLAQKLYISQNGKCACCGEELNGKFHMDHIMPLALGGLNIDSNIQLLTPSCNCRKQDRHPDEYMAWRTQSSNERAIGKLG